MREKVFIYMYIYSFIHLWQVDKDGDGLVGKKEAKSMLRALAEFRAFYTAALLKDAGDER